MTRDPASAQLADDIRSVYRKDPRQGARNIEALLEARLAGCSADERRDAVRGLIRHFEHRSADVEGMDQTDMLRLFGILLGRKVEQDDLSSGVLLHRLAQSLNTIFDALNQLISVINMSFNVTAGGEDQTIRQFIGFHLEGGDQTKSLQEYLGQINQAFLTTHEAFKLAAEHKMAQVIKALDVNAVAGERGGGIKIGPLRKAEDFDILSEKIAKIQRWFESGRFMEDFLREFEKHCQTFNK